MIVIPTASNLTLIRNGVETSLSDGTVLLNTPDGPVTLLYIADDGLGMAPITRFSERAPAQHGDTDLGFLLEPRVVSYIFAIYAPPTDDSRHLDAARMLLLKQFRPSRDAVSFRYDRANGDVMQIDGHFTGGMQFGSADREPGAWFQRFSADFKMPDPTWYDPTPMVFTLTNTNWSSGMPVPLVVPVAVGASDFNASQVIVYTGTWESYPALRITGPIRSPIITHTQLGLTLPLTANGGATIGQGEYWDINLEGSFKTIVDSAGVSQMAYLADPNNLDTFRFAAVPDIADGSNTIVMTGAGSNGNTSLRIGFRERYIGI